MYYDRSGMGSLVTWLESAFVESPFVPGGKSLAPTGTPGAEAAFQAHLKEMQQSPEEGMKYDDKTGLMESISAYTMGTNPKTGQKQLYVTDTAVVGGGTSGNYKPEGDKWPTYVIVGAVVLAGGFYLWKKSKEN